MTTYTEQLGANLRGDSRRTCGAVAPAWSVVGGGRGLSGHKLVSREMFPTHCRLIADVTLHPPR